MFDILNISYAKNVNSYIRDQLHHVIGSKIQLLKKLQALGQKESEKKKKNENSELDK